MAGWNGAGVFVLPYSMVAEAASGVKILASHQDTQWNAIKAGLENCLTRDGQTKPSADIDWGGKRIINVGNPVNPTDVANKGYIDNLGGGGGGGGSPGTEWIVENHQVIWVGPYSFRVLGGDYRTAYSVGKRVRVVHNAGGTTSYGTVTSSSYPGPGGFTTDTVIGVRLDDASGLVSPVMTVAYGLLSYINPSYLDPRSATCAYLYGNQAYTGGDQKIIVDSVSPNIQAEYDAANHRIVVKHDGIYLISATMLISPSAATGAGSHLIVYKNGAALLEQLQVGIPANYTPFVIPGIPLSLATNDYLELYANCPVSATIWGSDRRITSLSVTRIA